MVQNLSDSFHTHLEARVADSTGLKRDAHSVRYKVYCLERGYEKCESFPDGLEMDEFDIESIHGVVRYKSSKYPLGVVRLVLPNLEKPEREFPIESHFGEHLEKQTLDKFKFTRLNIGEVSRFAVSKEALKRVQELLNSETTSNQESLDQNDHPKELLPHISLGLISLLFVISKEQGIEYWYAAMEPSLSRLLTRLGIKFTPIGPIMDYHGRRQPMIANVRSLLENIERTRKDFFQLIRDIGGSSFDQAQNRNQHHETRMMDTISYPLESVQY
ncbi:MAG: PEP-CTERM/exosortase system-associated acyltransferase [Gammaproteobacteria bacterium]|nr:PEP-CTERM/exosortase system-associated acyltransferase [Gammaproteobacteria bacterium]